MECQHAGQVILDSQLTGAEVFKRFPKAEIGYYDMRKMYLRIIDVFDGVERIVSAAHGNTVAVFEANRADYHLANNWLLSQALPKSEKSEVVFSGDGNIAGNED